jgi:hypothetical protein
MAGSSSAVAAAASAAATSSSLATAMTSEIGRALYMARKADSGQRATVARVRRDRAAGWLAGWLGMQVVLDGSR